MGGLGPHGVVVGGRTSEGKVVVPPPEYDPVTHEQLTDLVEVSEVGTVASWAWVPEPVKGQPLDRPFAFALVTLDGADAPLLHAVDVASASDMSTGMRVLLKSHNVNASSTRLNAWILDMSLSLFHSLFFWRT